MQSALGAVVEGVDLSQSLTAAAQSHLRRLLDEHLVLVFPEQQLSSARHVEIGEVFGEPYVHPFLESVAEHEAILRVAKEPEDETVFGGEFWHADITFRNPPSSVSLLYAMDVPAEPCGDTLFANQFFAFDRLSAGMQTMLEGLDAVHVYPDMA